tara:strand:+ start:22620 stop:23906 length:1287 start_codon:yes stop_codon:yes gene_type:complete
MDESKRIMQGRHIRRRQEKDYGEDMGGSDVSVLGDAPLRIVVGGPPHSGKSTLMHLLEDKFNEYGVPVELVDMDLSAPTDLRSKEGFTVTREKRDWTMDLADEAANLFRDAQGEVVLGDSVGLISSITEILSQPADVAILIASGNKGDDNEIYQEVVKKWKNFYDMEDVRLPLLVVVRSSLNPMELSMFDPQDNYGVIVGLDRKAYEEGVINTQDACIEGIVFEIGQAFDIVFTSAMSEPHRIMMEEKWPSVKDIDTWRPESAMNLSPEKRAKLSGLEQAYLESKRRPDFQMGDEYGAENDDDEGLFYDELEEKIEAKEKEIRDFKEYLDKVGYGRQEIRELNSMEQELAELKQMEFSAENFNAYTSRFSKKNPNTRSKIVSRGRRIVQADPEYQQFRKYSFAGLGLLSLGFYLLARNSKSDNDSNNG